MVTMVARGMTMMTDDDDMMSAMGGRRCGLWVWGVRYGEGNGERDGWWVINGTVNDQRNVSTTMTAR